MKFTEKEKLTTPLFADPEKKVATEYGVLGTNGFAKRTTFVIDKKGVVRKIYPAPKPADHAEEVLKYVKENLK
jgi:peroxiredoxin Q/BCP